MTRAQPLESAADGWVLWGSELSPFALKVEALLRFAGVGFRWLPASGSFFEAFRFDRRRRRLVARRLPLTWPKMTDLDEFPLVPFVFGPAGENLYDSSAIAAWLDQRVNSAAHSPLLPTGDAALRFAVRLIDEALDEVGLYLVHHNRWVVSARDNDAGMRLAREMRALFGPLAVLVGYSFPGRQVRRLPYLFSVAPSDAAGFDDLPARLRPPSRPGFPPTHKLIEGAFAQLLGAIEPMLSARAYLLGERFTLADASLYGQLGMNRSDPGAWRWIRRDAPATAAWIERIARGDFHPQRPDGRLSLDDPIAPLLDWICRTLVPLMQQNHDAWQRHHANGETRFNEAAFDAGRALYDGTLLGQPFRSVVKTFQVRVWRDLRAEWDALAPADRARLETLLPSAHGLDHTGLSLNSAALARPS
ncbi:MAG TPA: glutathione S-transferase C-terminal domain-containing protein [Candidatus Binatia bacterium]|nr:glutathione S-transferase C-terminal domain-containing protein [Candidatus Binatia bacterium]